MKRIKDNNNLTRQSLMAKLNKQLAAYSTLAAGVLAAQSADAAVNVSNNIVHVSGETFSIIVAGATVTSLWDISGSANVDGSPGAGSLNPFQFTAYFNPLSATSLAPKALQANRQNASNAWVRPSGAPDNRLGPMAVGKVVGSVLTGGYAFQTAAIAAFTTGSGLAAGGGFTSGTPGLPVSGKVGFRFNSDPGGTNQIWYGWADVTIDAQSLTINQWAYKNDGTPIVVGAIPEPNSLAYLIAGYAGLVEMRRRRKSRADAREAEMNS